MSARVLALALALLASSVFLLARRGREGSPSAASTGPRASDATLEQSGGVLHDPVVPEGAVEPDPETAVPPAPVPPGDRPDVSTADRVAGPVECVLYGRVLDSGGIPVRGWKPYISMTDSAGERRNTEVSDEGHYSVAGLAPGEWILGVGAVAYRHQEHPLVLSSDAPLVRRDLVIERAVALSVRVVTPAGEKLIDAMKARGERLDRGIVPFVIATLEPPDPTMEEAQHAGADQVGVGSFWTHGPLWEAAGPESIGVLVLTVDLPVFVSLMTGSHVAATQRVEPGAEEVTFVVDPEDWLARQCSIRARFVSAETGAPLKGSLELAAGPAFNSWTRLDDGLWREDLPPGSYTFAFSSPGHARVPQNVTLVPGQELDLGDIALPPEVTIEGRLVDGDGNPIAGLLVLGQRNDSGALSFDEDRAFAAGQDGRFKVSGLLPGRYALRTCGDDEIRSPHRQEPPTVWVSGNVPVSTLGGSVSGFELRLVRAGFLVLENALDSGAAGCRILDAEGDLLRAQRFQRGFVPRLVLPPGACTLVLFDEAGLEIDRRRIEIGSEVVAVDLAR